MRRAVRRPRRRGGALLERGERASPRRPSSAARGAARACSALGARARTRACVPSGDQRGCASPVAEGERARRRRRAVSASQSAGAVLVGLASTWTRVNATRVPSGEICGSAIQISRADRPRAWADHGHTATRRVGRKGSREWPGAAGRAGRKRGRNLAGCGSRNVSRTVPAVRTGMDRRFAPPFCPRSSCPYHRCPAGWRYKRIGFYTRHCPPRRIQRYLCLHCRRSFSTQTFSTTYWLRRPELLEPLFFRLLACSGFRQIARELKAAPSTLVHLAARLGRHCLLFQRLHQPNGRRAGRPRRLRELRVEPVLPLPLPRPGRLPIALLLRLHRLPAAPQGAHDSAAASPPRAARAPARPARPRVDPPRGRGPAAALRALTRRRRPPLRRSPGLSSRLPRAT